VFPNDFVVDWVRVYARPQVPALLNPGFENAALAPWTRFGEASIVNYGNRSGSRALRADSGASREGAAPDRSGVQQTVYGLQPNTRYRIYVYARTEGQASAVLGVKDAEGGEQLRTYQGNGLMALTFTTPDKAKSATLFCASQGEGTVFFDDVWVEAVE
jgi:hypothetical protein